MLPAITSLQNPTVKNLVRLRRRRQRDRQRLMLIDGLRALELALKNGFRVETVFAAEDALSGDWRQRPWFGGARVQPVSGAVFSKIGYGDTPDGVLGLAPQPAFELRALPVPPRPLYVVAEGLEKPGNLGAILRSADAAGASGIIVCDSRTDICNPNVVRASRGALFTVPVAQTSTPAALRWLRERGVQVLAAAPDAGRPYTGADMSRPTALAVGAEQRGLSETWLAETPVSIPMTGQVDSLNVAQTASVLLFEAVRQRAAL
ncbi:MAG: TrmH family RNA methyltransferase [Anaerolineae bacterium]